MNSSLKSAVLGVGLLVAAAATAQAQSVSSLPPTNPATVPSATTPPVSNAKIVPNPGNNSTWKEEHATATSAVDNPGSHPYTIPHFAPAPN